MYEIERNFDLPVASQSHRVPISVRDDIKGDTNPVSIPVPLPPVLRFHVTPAKRETNPSTMLVLDIFLIPHRLGIDDPDPDRDPSVRGEDEEEDAGVEHILVEPEVVIFRRRFRSAAVVEVVLAIAVGRSNVRASPVFRLAMLAFNVFANQTVVIPRM